MEPTPQEIKKAQGLINSGMAWKPEGSIGQYCMSMIKAGYCTQGTKGHNDAYGNYVPSRYEVKQGTKGSPDYIIQARMARM